jgi:hypothetical protein
MRTTGLARVDDGAAGGGAGAGGGGAGAGTAGAGAGGGGTAGGGGATAGGGATGPVWTGPASFQAKRWAWSASRSTSGVATSGSLSPATRTKSTELRGGKRGLPASAFEFGAPRAATWGFLPVIVELKCRWHPWAAQWARG